jgi:hypothetical protein
MVYGVLLIISGLLAFACIVGLGMWLARGAARHPATAAQNDKIVQILLTIKNYPYLNPDWIEASLTRHLLTPSIQTLYKIDGPLPCFFAFLNRHLLNKMHCPFAGYPASLPRDVVWLLRTPWFGGVYPPAVNPAGLRIWLGLRLRRRNDSLFNTTVEKLRLEKPQADALIAYFEDSHLADLGFPIFADGLSAQGGNSNLAHLFAAALYRVAYGHPDVPAGIAERDKKSWYEQLKSQQFRGAYRIFLKRAGRAFIESRILILDVQQSYNGEQPHWVLAVEISRTEEGQWRVRTGVVAPSFDVHTIVLSDVRTEITAATLAKYLSREVAERVNFNLDTTYRITDSSNLLRAQDLLFFALRYQEFSIQGSFHRKEDVGLFVGRKLHSGISLMDMNAVTAPTREFSLVNIGDADRDLIELIRRLCTEENDAPPGPEERIPRFGTAWL